jgi:mono/diheme cytochrome c family protein
MPATEQTWRDSKLLHVIFGVTALLMLITTIWMLAADHRREWKTYQSKFQNIEAWSAQARLSQQESQQYEQDVAAAHAALAKAQQEVPAATLVNRFNDLVRARVQTLNEQDKTSEQADTTEVDSAYKALQNAPSEELRNQFRAALQKHIDRARFVENTVASDKKFRAAELDVARSEYELGVGNVLPKAQLDAMQARVTELRKLVDDTNNQVQNASNFRKDLERIVGEMFAPEAAARKTLDDLMVEKTLLETALYDRETKVMNEVIGLPIIDAFSPKKIDQIWLPKLTINNNFRDVPRFDRCTNCHQGIDRTAPGSAIDPAYPEEQIVTLSLATPAERPEALSKEPAEGVSLERHYNNLINEIYGLQLAQHGLIDPNEAVISVVRAETPGAKAGLIVSDTITAVDGSTLLDKKAAYNYLLETVQWGQPLQLTVRRGLPQPFASHPRLDLFVGSLSPHTMAGVGCTICHDGQGSATAFKYVSHAPSDPLQAEKWKREYGWYDNHHWIFPMYPNRFAESLCLKCHHDVVELQASERFPEPPAPKLMEGFNLIKDVGCFGCHEINGYDGPNRRIGPDLRAEPNFAPAAQALLATGKLSDQQQEWARQVIAAPDQAAPRHSLTESLATAEELPGDPTMAKRWINTLADVETPGKLRKVGPSLRHVASKLDFEFLYSWIRQPKDFRPSTKMPQFFGLWSALGHEGLEQSQKYEPIEIRGITEYLLTSSQPFDFIEPSQDVTEAASAERGKLAFEVRCLACHKQEAFPAGTMTQGPDLSKLGSKLATAANANGPKWLYTWLRNPSAYHPRTLMPNMILDPFTGTDGKLTDPAADIAAFLLASKGWEPQDVPGRDLTKEESQALEALALENLQNTFSRRQAEDFLKTGIPERMRADLKGDEVELIGEMTVEKKLRYVGRRSISKYGCNGCHDIPNFEDVKPIGTGLADWARKTPDKLAFEQIVEYMKTGHGKPGALHYGDDENHSIAKEDEAIEEAETAGHGHAFNFLNMDPTTGYFMEKLVGHQREGFIWQKLREPRSYDFQKTQNKGYNERLRMPEFTVLNDDQREAIITFVLGLVAEPPAQQYIFKADPRRQAIIAGNEVIEKFNCTGCHTLEMERWDLAFAPGTFGEAAEVVDFDFLKAHFTPQQIEASKAVDARGLQRALVTGMPVVNEAGQAIRFDEAGGPIEPDDTETPASYAVTPWDSVLLGGNPWQAGLQNLLIPASAVQKRYEPIGGFLARLAFPAVIENERKTNPNVKPDEAWGWLPPPLKGEGRKVQTEWLHDFLLDPHVIRPAAVLRMPKFNMSTAEATKLVNYFAAVDGVDYPYDFDPRTREAHLAEAAVDHPQRMNDALKIVTDNNFCIKCHLLGDFVPTGAVSAQAPQLDKVSRRIRPEFALDWIANPKRILPYTGMPQNIEANKPVSQELFKGDSQQQLDGVVDLLLNFDRFMGSKTSIKPLIKPQAPAEAQPGAQSQDAAQ